MEVYLSENSFIGLLVSTVEVYRRECFGILLGHREPDRIMVDFVVPYQSAKRKFQEVHMDWYRGQRVEEAVRATSRWELVGDYHSHPCTERRRPPRSSPARTIRISATTGRPSSWPSMTVTASIDGVTSKGASSREA